MLVLVRVPVRVGAGVGAGAGAGAHGVGEGACIHETRGFRESKLAYMEQDGKSIHIRVSDSSIRVAPRKRRWAEIGTRVRLANTCSAA